MGKHTPGPWFQQSNSCAITSMNRDICDSFEGDDIDVANARLIAAAPDLLDALVGLFNHKGEYRQDSTADALWMKAYDAIAKATGAA